MLQDVPFGQELGMDVLVVRELAEEEHLLGQSVRNVARGEAAHAFGGHVYQVRIVPFAEFHEVLDAAVVDVLDVRSLGEVLHVGGAVEHHIDVLQRSQGLGLGNVSGHGLDARPKEAAVVFVEVVHHHFLEASLRGEGALFPEQAPDGGVRAGGFQQLLQHVDAQEAGGAGEEDIPAQSNTLSLLEGLQVVLRKQRVYGRIVVIRDVGVLVCRTLVSSQEGGQRTGRRVGEDVGIGKVQALFLGIHHHVGNHQGRASQVEEGVRCTHLFYAQDLSENGAEGLLCFSHGGNVLVHGGRRGLRQGLAVHLLVHVERDGVQLHPGGGYHVRWLALADEVGGGLGVKGAVGHHISGQELAAGRGVEGLYGHILHAREFLQHALHFL